MTKSYTAILSIHGIGRHRRHANSGALLSSLEAVCVSSDAELDDTIIQVQSGIEPPRDRELREDVPFLKLKRARRQGGKLKIGAAFRIYEVNWSPDTRARVPFWAMLIWTIRLLKSALRREPSNWLLWPRLRLARLRLAADGGRVPGLKHAMVVLASAYRNYRGTIGSRYRAADSAQSDFDNFVKFAQSHAKQAATSRNIKDASQIWHGTDLPCETGVRRAGRLAIFSLLAILLLSAAIAATFFGNANISTFWSNLLFFVLAFPVIIVLIGGVRFLTSTFSDVRYWATLDENHQFHDTRSAILERAVATLRHLVSDPACGRVVIVSHSLGTAIAYDALCAIGLYNRARKDTKEEWIAVRKVDCLITMGSPIDKLALLFETTSSDTFREELIHEELRGDLTSMPFWVGDRQRIKWINFWDPVDSVADALEIPRGAKPRGGHFESTLIENVEVANTAFHDPVGSHTGYFNNPVVATRLYNEIFRPEQQAIGLARNHAVTRCFSLGLIRLAFAGLAILLATFIIAHTTPWTRALEIALWCGAFAIASSTLGFVGLGLWFRLKRR